MAELPLPASETRPVLSEDTQTFVTFWLGEHLFGLPIAEVVEINRKMEITPVPLAPPYIKGIINLRGQVLTTVDLAERLGLQVEAPRAYNLIVKTEDEERISFLVEKIGDILEVPSKNVEEPPERIEGVERKFVRHVCQLPERLLVILNVREVLQDSG
ncbi:chemotaxis protein CheW [Thermosulfurimonas sp.]|uniref:chemotaxis protein CheW n=1 Tax=Thermosulfurimonas sp. TaxID=2080236 RepID=UPI0025DD826D|nr:chemotaxis protein CheW [Thermosulfurimonas sp.]